MTLESPCHSSTISYNIPVVPFIWFILINYEPHVPNNFLLQVKCWQIRRQIKAPQAAGTIHSDFERGFICAEVIFGSPFFLLAHSKFCLVRLTLKFQLVQQYNFLYWQKGQIGPQHFTLIANWTLTWFLSQIEP